MGEDFNNKYLIYSYSMNECASEQDLEVLQDFPITFPLWTISNFNQVYIFKELACVLIESYFKYDSISGLMLYLGDTGSHPICV